MKESTLATKVMMAVICIGVMIYMGIYIVQGFQGELATAVAYQDSVRLGSEATGIMVRQEQVISASGQYVDVLLAEGERVSAGGQIALVHSSSSALETRQSIQTLEAEIEQLEYALSTGTQGVNLSKVDEQVISSIVQIRALSASRDLSTLEDSALHLRTMVFQRDYSYGDTNAANQMSALIDQKKAQLTSLTSSLSQVSQAITAPVSGIFSGEVDGYESTLTPDMLADMTPEQLSQLLTQDTPANGGGLGKLITNSTWYFATLLDGENASHLQEGKKYDVTFSHDYYGTISMTLERLAVTDTQTMAIFSCNTHLSDTTLLRVQTVDVVTQVIEGIRIPRQSLRVETKTVTDEDGSESQVNTYGVYTVVGTQAEWQEVNVLYSDAAFYLVEPVDKESSSRLRAGDETILNTMGIEDGKVVRG